MKLTLVHFFTLYVTVFLAVLLIAWLFFLRTRRRSELDSRRIFICEACQCAFTERVPYQRPRCPKCGAVYDVRSVKEPGQDGNASSHGTMLGTGKVPPERG